MLYNTLYEHTNVLMVEELKVEWELGDSIHLHLPEVNLYIYANVQR